jgi:hypothetical protein
VRASTYALVLSSDGVIILLAFRGAQLDFRIDKGKYQGKELQRMVIAWPVMTFKEPLRNTYRPRFELPKCFQVGFSHIFIESQLNSTCFSIPLFFSGLHCACFLLQTCVYEFSCFSGLI